MIIMKKTIDFSLEQMLKDDELGSVEQLRKVIGIIIKKYGDITNTTIEKYNADPDAEYTITITVGKIRDYLRPYGYVVKKDLRECIVQVIDFPHYKKIREKIKDIDKDIN